MKGVKYIIDDQGEKTAVIINLEQWGKEWEAFYNLLLKQSFPSESWLHQASLSEKLDKALLWNHNHRNNTVSGKLSALALRGKRARQFIALNLSAN